MFQRLPAGRMLRMTSFAPDIIKAILRGGEPDGLSLEKLRKPVLSAAEGNLPVRWDEQRNPYGIARDRGAGLTVHRGIPEERSAPQQ